MHGNLSFAAAINCMDGRTQAPVSKWVKEKFHVDLVDMITEPGPDKILSQGPADKIESIKSRLLISVNKHDSRAAVIAGHHDCAGNPVSKEEHIEHLKKSVETVKSWNLGIEVVGVWVNDRWDVEEVPSESGAAARVMPESLEISSNK